ncbi:hypothetical protein BC940DRAFT_321944 [Gongronella butleri]|nr:hypothetical protein BC940DRAFT_321944 [Gongronella butleri]
MTSIECPICHQEFPAYDQRGFRNPGYTAHYNRCAERQRQLAMPQLDTASSRAARFAKAIKRKLLPARPQMDAHDTAQMNANGGNQLDSAKVSGESPSPSAIQLAPGAFVVPSQLASMHSPGFQSTSSTGSNSSGSGSEITTATATTSHPAWSAASASASSDRSAWMAGHWPQRRTRRTGKKAKTMPSTTSRTSQLYNRPASTATMAAAYAYTSSMVMQRHSVYAAAMPSSSMNASHDVAYSDMTMPNATNAIGSMPQPLMPALPAHLNLQQPAQLPIAPPPLPLHHQQPIVPTSAPVQKQLLSHEHTPMTSPSSSVSLGTTAHPSPALLAASTFSDTHCDYCFIVDGHHDPTCMLSRMLLPPDYNL